MWGVFENRTFDCGETHRIVRAVEWGTVQKVQRLLHENNSLARKFKTALENNTPNPSCRADSARGATVCAPINNEIATLAAIDRIARSLVSPTLVDTAMHDALEYPIVFRRELVTDLICPPNEPLDDLRWTERYSRIAWCYKLYPTR